MLVEKACWAGEVPSQLRLEAKSAELDCRCEVIERRVIDRKVEGKIARHVHLRGEVAQQKAKSHGVRSDSQLTHPFILVKKACRRCVRLKRDGAN